MAYVAGEYAVTASAVNISTALGSRVKQKHCKQIILQLNDAAANAVQVGQSDVTTGTNRGFTLVSGAGVQPKVLELSSTDGHVSTDDVYLIGVVNAANIVFITLVY